MVKGTTKSGIKFQFSETIKDDMRFWYIMTELESIEKITDDMSDDKKAEICKKQSKLIFDMLNIVFGTNEGLLAFMNEVAAVNNGVCDSQSMMKEFNEMLEALNLKNS